VGGVVSSIGLKNIALRDLQQDPPRGWCGVFFAVLNRGEGSRSGVHVLIGIDLKLCTSFLPFIDDVVGATYKRFGATR
jgi:hypothetical protein